MRRRASKKKEKPPPEGPEVRVIADQLNSVLKGAQIFGVDVLGGRYEKHGAPPGLIELNFPVWVESVDCKGKFIWFRVVDKAHGEQKFIWNTLGMTGHWSRKRESHARVLLRTDAGDFYFCDMRNFGTMHFNRTSIEHERKVKSLGIDLLKGNVDVADFCKVLMKGKKKAINESLMDQSILAGVGNYIKCEALYRSGISPLRLTQGLSGVELEKLQVSLTHVMAASYAAKGHSMSDYHDIDGEKGSFKFELLVYNQAKDPDGNVVMREKTKDGRTTHWVPSIQK